MRGTPCGASPSSGSRSGWAFRWSDIGAALARLPEGRTPTRDDWARLSKAWREELDERIRQLEKLRDSLSDCIGCGCLSIDRCRLRNPWDQLGTLGPGAHRLVVAGKQPQPDRTGDV